MSTSNITFNACSNFCLPLLLSFTLLGCDKTVITEPPEVAPHEHYEEGITYNNGHSHEGKEDDHDEHEHAHEGHNHDSEVNGHDEHEHTHGGHTHEANVTHYNCTPEKDIAVFYSHDNDSQLRTAHLLIDDIEYDLESTTPDIEASNMNYTYVSDIGFDETHALVWQTSQKVATLKTPDLENSNTIAAEPILFDCHKKL